MNSSVHRVSHPTSATKVDNRRHTHKSPSRDPTNQSVKQHRQPPSLRSVVLGGSHLLLELEEPRRGDEHHERLSQLPDGVLEEHRRLLVVVSTTALADIAADARAALESLHDEHPMLGEEAARGALRDAALRSPREHGGADDAGHAHEQRVVPLQGGGVSRPLSLLEKLRVRREEA